MAEFVQSEMKVLKPDGAILISQESLEKILGRVDDAGYLTEEDMKRLLQEFKER